MILKRLYELANREHLLDDLAFEYQPVPIIIKLDTQGNYLGIEERRGVVTIPSRKQNTPPKIKPDKGKELLVPKAHGNTANRGFARYFVDTLPRVLPISDDAKSGNSRMTFWQQIEQAASETQDAALLAMCKFYSDIDNDNLVSQIKSDLEIIHPDAGARCTFAWHPDGGSTICERATVCNWYRNFFTEIISDRQDSSEQGICQITGLLEALPSSHTTKINGLRGGLSTGVALVSNDKAAFESYGLDGAVNSGIGYRAAEGYTRALNALLTNKLPGRPRTCLYIGEITFLFWTRLAVANDDIMQLDQPQPDAVVRLIESANLGQIAFGVNPNDYYCLSLSSNAARAIVRDYLEAPVPEVQMNLGRWFHDLQIVDEWTGRPTATFSLWRLAGTTVREGDDISPNLPVVLMAAALKNKPVPAQVLAACLRRICVDAENRKFAPERMGLIKLILNRFNQQGTIYMNEQLDSAV